MYPQPSHTWPVWACLSCIHNEMGLPLDLGSMMFLEIVRAKAQGPMGLRSCPVHFCITILSQLWCSKLWVVKKKLWAYEKVTRNQLQCATHKIVKKKKKKKEKRKKGVVNSLYCTSVWGGRITQYLAYSTVLVIDASVGLFWCILRSEYWVYKSSPNSGPKWMRLKSQRA